MNITEDLQDLKLISESFTEMEKKLNFVLIAFSLCENGEFI
jgi:hypothetical protein